MPVDPPDSAVKPAARAVILRSCGLALLIVVGVVLASSQTEKLERHEASTVILATDLRFNVDRFSRVTSGLLQEANTDLTARRTALPIEKTRLVQVSVRGPDPETALAEVVPYAEQVLGILRRSELATFEIAGDAQVVKVARPRSTPKAAVVGAGSFVLLAGAFVGLSRSWSPTVARREAIEVHG